jgi:hypothetical protein
VIAYSGETGSTEKPVLGFEIKEKKGAGGIVWVFVVREKF